MKSDVLFVCTGNTCRSPMAMTIFNLLSKDKKAESAGLQVASPSGAAENACLAVKKYGGNLENHISRQLTVEDLSNYSLIITMTETQKEMLRMIYNDDKIITLAEFAGENKDISDPFGGSVQLYENTAQMIYEYIKKGLEKETKCSFAAMQHLDKIVKMENDIFPDSWSESSVEREIKNNRIIVIKDKENIFGYCIFMIAADEGEILRIAIDKSKRKQGFGKKLLDNTLMYLENNGCNDVFLEVRKSNEGAISLYKSAGFEEIGVRKGYYNDNGEDALIFKKEIKER